MENKEPKRKRVVTHLLSLSKLLVFATFIYTALVMYKLGNLITSGVIVIAVSLFLMFNKLESMQGSS